MQRMDEVNDTYSGSSKASCKDSEDRSMDINDAGRESRPIPGSAGHRSYARWVSEYASLSALHGQFSGTHLTNFAKYLGQPYERRNSTRVRNYTNGSNTSVSGLPFALLHDFAAPDSLQRRTLQSPTDLDQIAQENNVRESQAQILFLQGHPSPEWLNAIGATFGVDPEFLLEHFEMFSKSQLQAAWSNPALPSRSVHQPRLLLSTIGRLAKADPRAGSTKQMQALRLRGRLMFERYLDSMRREDGIELGASLVRRYSVHSGSNFSYDQDAALYVRGTDKGWFGIAWLDVGNDLADGPEGQNLMAPMDGNRKNTLFLSTVQHRTLKFPALPSRTSRPLTGQQLASSIGVAQNARHLAEEYASHLSPVVARVSAFYACSELFGFAADSQLQFLNMMTATVASDLEHAIGLNSNEVPLTNLLYNQQILGEHIHRLEDNLSSIQAYQSWPRSSQATAEEMQCMADTATRLLRDFECLVRKARALALECDRGVRVVMNIASVAESKKVLEQAKGVENLTRLAFAFVPLSITASFFGMNFKQLGQGDLPLWIWFAVSVPIFALSVVFMSTKLRRLMLRMLTRHRNGKEETVLEKMSESCGGVEDWGMTELESV